jgi:hypothetical protein
MNWKTSIAGLVAAIIPWLKGVFPDFGGILDGVQSLAFALLGYFAKDNNKV